MCVCVGVCVGVCVCVGGEREGEMHLQVLLKNEFLSNCLLLGNTKDCSHNYLDKTKLLLCSYLWFN